MNNLYKDYGWKDPALSSHTHLLPTLLKAMTEFKIDKNDFILDVGCGGGNVMNYLWSNDFKNIYGFDASESAIIIGKKNFPEISQRLFIHNAYEKILPVSLQYNFDTIYSLEVIEHFYDPYSYLQNISVWLKKKGLLIISTPYHGYFRNLIVALFNKSDRHFNPLWTGGHIKFFSKETLSKILKETGFIPIKFYWSGRVPYLQTCMIVICKKL